MPYETIEDLPISVRDHLPRHAQVIYQEAFNSAWQQYTSPSARRGDETREQVAHKVAWAAVKSRYHKDNDGMWRAA